MISTRRKEIKIPKIEIICNVYIYILFIIPENTNHQNSTFAKHLIG